MSFQKLLIEDMSLMSLIHMEEATGLGDQRPLIVLVDGQHIFSRIHSIGKLFGCSLRFSQQIPHLLVVRVFVQHLVEQGDGLFVSAHTNHELSLHALNLGIGREESFQPVNPHHAIFPQIIVHEDACRIIQEIRSVLLQMAPYSQEVSHSLMNASFLDKYFRIEILDFQILLVHNGCTYVPCLICVSHEELSTSQKDLWVYTVGMQSHSQLNDPICILLAILGHVKLCYISKLISLHIDWFALPDGLFIFGQSLSEFRVSEILLVFFCGHSLTVSLGIGVLQPHGLVEYQMLGGAFGIHIEIAYTLELQVTQWRHGAGKLLHIAVREHVQTVGIDDLLHGCHGIAVLSITDGSHLVARILHLPESVI